MADTACSDRAESRWPDDEERRDALIGESMEGSSYSGPSFRVSCDTAIVGRSMFITASGFLGLSSTAARPEDEVVIFQGLRWPFILRNRQVSSTWRMIDHAYVHGIMNGEAFLSYQRGGSQMQDFVID